VSFFLVQGGQPLPKLLEELRQAGRLADRISALAALAVTYRDLAVTLEALYESQNGIDPFEPADAREEGLQASANAAGSLERQDGGSALTASRQRAGDMASSTREHEAPLGTYVPLVDVTQHPDHMAVDGVTPVPTDPPLDMRYMDRVSCWPATQPSHLETSQALLTAIKLFPPEEASYPTYIDFDAAQRLLAHHTSRKRLRLQRRLVRKQDKYQLRTWSHYVGEA
jgi:hypothetical protein